LPLLPRSKLRRFLLAAAGLFLLLAALAYLFPRQILCVDSGSAPLADAIVLLGGGQGDRPPRAAELYKGGFAPRIIVTGAGDITWNCQQLIAAGVPKEAIELEPNAKTTRENALFTMGLIRAQDARRDALGPMRNAPGVARVILVTSWYHSRRSLRTFQHYAPDIQFYSCPSYFGYDRSRWSRDGVTGYVRSEYIKLLGYWICYGVCPL